MPPSFIDTEEGPPAKFDFGLLRRLTVYVAPYRRLIALAVVCALTAMGARVAWTYLFIPSVNAVAERAELAALTPLIAGLLLLPLLWFAVQYVQIYTVSYVGQQAMHRLRRELFAKLQRLAPAYFDKNPLGRIMTRVTNDVEVLNELFSSGVVAAIADVFMLGGILAMLFHLNADLTLRVICLIPFIVAASATFRKYAHAAFRKTRRRLAALNAFLQESISGIRIVQIFNREPKSQRRFDELNGRFRDANLEAVLCFSIFFPVVEFLAVSGAVIVIWIGGGGVIGGEFKYGELYGYLAFVNLFFEPLRDLSEKFNILQSAMAASERIAGILDTPETITSPAQPAPASPFQDRIAFQNVWFHYGGADTEPTNPAPLPDNRQSSIKNPQSPAPSPQPPDPRPQTPNWVLRDVSFEVKRGERVAIVGATGAGKTTLISLLTRFYDIQQGAIALDGIDIRQMKLGDLRGRLAIVLQDVFLFTGDVAGNIRLANGDIDDAQIERAARAVNAERFIKRLPGGYHSKVREGGATFSMGQRQLLAFARALAYDPEILVLDEATANIDTETELLIQDALEKLFAGRTSIVIAHRLSTIRHADKIVVMHRGKIRETGTHQQLLRQNGIYRRLCEMQYGKTE